MSAQRLSEACGELGLSIPRSVLANLESGRRETVSVAELLVLAAALEVPPLQLLFPVGYAEEVEPLPGVKVTPYDAVLWGRGLQLLEGLDGDEGEFLDWIDAFEQHEHTVSELLNPDWTPTPGNAEELEQFKRYTERLKDDLLRERAALRTNGRTPPPLPPELASLDERGPRGRRRSNARSSGEDS